MIICVVLTPCYACLQCVSQRRNSVRGLDASKQLFRQFCQYKSRELRASGYFAARLFIWERASLRRAMTIAFPIASIISNMPGLTVPPVSATLTG